MSARDPVDWALAERVGRMMSGSGPTISLEERSQAWRDFTEFSVQSDELVRSFTGLAPADAAPEPIVLSRGDWISANLEGFRGIVRPITEKLSAGMTASGPARAITAAALGVQIGVLLGYLSQKVLGQYDLLLASEGAGRVYFVGPNVVEAERKMGLEPRDFRLWITLHEITHRTQFTGVPWLRERVRGLMERSLQAIELDGARVRELLARARELLLGGPAAWRSANVMTLLLSDKQRVVLEEMQALMCVIEGHGTFVMNRVGEKHIPSFTTLRDAIESRRGSARGADRVFQRAMGMDMKYEQYALGEKFMNQVADLAGEDAVNAVWARAENLPSMDDLRDPAAWLARVSA